MIKRKRKIERALADLLRSLGISVYEIGGVPHVDVVRFREPGREDDTICESGVDALSLEFIADWFDAHA
jgi:hypothetical protein